MPKNGEEVRRRLQEAALELYTLKGFDETTTAEIAAQAGVTERTFFRHFADKREVFFEGEQALITELCNGMRGAPDTAAPMELLLCAFHAVAPLVEANRPFLEPRQKVIAATPGLQERALAKNALVTERLSAALVERGIEPVLAMLAAQAGIAAFGYATRKWHADPSAGLNSHLDHAFTQLRELTQPARALVQRGKRK